MKKLSLRLEDLRIDSFSTSAPEKKSGTVFGEQCTCYTNCTCPGCPTCYDATCVGSCGAATCGASCAGTCGATCEYTCGDSCMGCTWDGCAAPTEAGFATFAGPNQQCIECAG